jgi:hypothetical protein
VAKKGKIKGSDFVHGQYINVFKLGAIWDGQDIKNHRSWSQ